MCGEKTSFSHLVFVIMASIYRQSLILIILTSVNLQKVTMEREKTSADKLPVVEKIIEKVIEKEVPTFKNNDMD